MKQFMIYSAMAVAFAACTAAKKNTKPVQDASLAETYWKVTEIMGKPVAATKENQKEAHMILKKETGRIQGNDGCNSFNGTYELKDPNRISFSKMMSTMMACPDVESETTLPKIFEMADSYYVKGDTLQLIKARMAPLAKFQAVYLK